MFLNPKENEAATKPPPHSSVFDQKTNQNSFIFQVTICFRLCGLQKSDHTNMVPSISQNWIFRSCLYSILNQKGRYRYKNRLEAMYWEQQKVNQIIQMQSLKTKQTSTVRE